MNIMRSSIKCCWPHFLRFTSCTRLELSCILLLHRHTHTHTLRTYTISIQSIEYVHIYLQSYLYISTDTTMHNGNKHNWECILEMRTANFKAAFNPRFLALRRQDKKMRITGQQLEAKNPVRSFLCFPCGGRKRKPHHPLDVCVCVQKIFSWQSFIGKICLWLLNFN